MTDLVLVTLVVVIVLAAHAGLYLWVRFRIDEGAITHFIAESGGTADTATIVRGTGISPHRVGVVCQRSGAIRQVEADRPVWMLA